MIIKPRRHGPAIPGKNTQFKDVDDHQREICYQKSVGIPHQLTLLKRSASNLWSGGRGRILLAIGAGWFLSIGVRLVYPVMLPYLQTAYDLTLTTAGFLLSVLWIAYAVGQLPGGVLADRIGEGTILLLSPIVSVGTLLLIIVARSTLVLFIATALFGLGTALYGVARYTSLSAIYPDHAGAAIGVTQAAGEVGNSVLPLLAGLIAAAFAWQYGFGFAVPLFALVALFLWAVVPSRISETTSAVDTLSVGTARYIVSELRQPEIIVVTVIEILAFSVWQSFTGFYPTYLIEVKELSPTVSSGLFGLFFAVGVIVQPLAGGAYDRVGIWRSLPVVMGVITVALVALPLLEGFWPLVAGTVLAGSILGYGTIVLPYMTDALPEDMKGTGLGVLRTVYMTIGAGSPLLFGALADRGFFDEAFVLLATLAGTTVLISIVVPGRWGID